MAEPPGALSLRPRRLKPFPAQLFLSSLHQIKMGTDAARRVPTTTNMDGQSPSREPISFGGIKLWPVLASRDILLLVIGEEFRQRSGFTFLLRRRGRDVDETERLWQPAGAFEKALGLPGHVGLLQMVDEPRRGLAFRLAHRLQDPWFGNAAEIVVDRWSPAGLDHVEPASARQNVGLIKTRPNAVGGDTALIVAVGVEGVDSKRRTVSEQGRLSRAVQCGQRLPEIRLALRQPLLPSLMPRVDGLG